MENFIDVALSKLCGFGDPLNEWKLYYCVKDTPCHNDKDVNNVGLSKLEGSDNPTNENKTVSSKHIDINNIGFSSIESLDDPNKW